MAVIPDSTPPLPLHVLNEHVECVDCFTYLGIDITNNGLSTKYIPNIQTSRVMCRLWNRFFFTQTTHQHKTKLNVYNARIISNLLCGAVSRAPTLRDRRRLHVQCWRRLLRLSW